MKGKKLLRFVDKIAQSKYFQQVAEYKYIRKAMEEVSNTRLVLTVELKSLSGTLAINIPPPPTDRLWYYVMSITSGIEFITGVCVVIIVVHHYFVLPYYFFCCVILFPLLCHSIIFVI